MFDQEMVPEELTQLRMGKIVRDRYPELSDDDQEAVRQHAIAALNLTQKAKEIALSGGRRCERRAKANTAFVDGVRKFAMDVRDLDIDLIDSINPFDAAYAILAKSMNEETLKQVQAVIAGSKVSITERGGPRARHARPASSSRSAAGCPTITSQDAWEKRHGRRRRRPRPHEGRGRQWLRSPTTNCAAAELGVEVEPKKAGSPHRRARSGSSRASRTSCASSRSMAARRSTARTATSSSGSTPCGSTACATWTIAARFWRRWTSTGCSDGDWRRGAAVDEHRRRRACWPNWARGRRRDDITELRHVRSSAEERAAEEIANREQCEDFDRFKPLFEQVQRDLDAGARETRPFVKTPAFSRPTSTRASSSSSAGRSPMWPRWAR